MKNVQTRLTQTIAFIQNTATPWLLADRAPIVHALTTWRANNALNASALGAVMSQNGTANRPATQLGRDYRRATILLRGALMPLGTPYATIANQVNASATPPATQYENFLKSARDEVYSEAVLANTELALLAIHPRRFLTRWRLAVYGTPAAGVLQYDVTMSNAIYRLDCTGGNPGNTTFQALNIPAQAYAGVQANLGAIPGTSSLGHAANVALTTQFTGCAFCFQIDGATNELLATHLDPTAAVGGGLLAPHLRLTGQFIRGQLIANGAFLNGNAGTFRGCGRDPVAAYAYDAVRVIIVSVFRNNEWRIYAQLQDPGNPAQWVVHRIDQGVLA